MGLNVFGKFLVLEMLVIVFRFGEGNREIVFKGFKDIVGLWIIVKLVRVYVFKDWINVLEF